MTDEELQKVAEAADMIVDGYAFTESDNIVRVLNLYLPDAALVLDRNGKILEANMSPTERQTVLDLWKRNSEFMGAASA